MSTTRTVFIINDRGQALAQRSGEPLNIDVEPGRYGRQLTAAVKIAGDSTRSCS